MENSKDVIKLFKNNKDFGMLLINILIVAINQIPF